MALPGSGTISLSDIASEMGGSTPHSLSEYYRGGSYVPNISTNTAIPTSGAISISNFYGASKTKYTPAAVNWTDVSGSLAGNSNSQTITDIAPSITISVSKTGSGTVAYALNGGSSVNYTAPFSVSPGDTIIWWVSGADTSGTVTVRNDSTGSSTIDTFNYTISGL